MKRTIYGPRAKLGIASEFGADGPKTYREVLEVIGRLT